MCGLSPSRRSKVQSMTRITACVCLFKGTYTATRSTLRSCEASTEGDSERARNLLLFKRRKCRWSGQFREISQHRLERWALSKLRLSAAQVALHVCEKCGGMILVENDD